MGLEMCSHKTEDLIFVGKMEGLKYGSLIMKPLTGQMSSMLPRSLGDCPCCDPAPIDTASTNTTNQATLSSENSQDRYSLNVFSLYLGRFVNAFNFAQLTPRVLYGMGMHDFVGLMTVLFVISQPESMTGVVYKITSIVSNRCLGGRFECAFYENYTDVVIASVVSGVETAYCLYHPNDERSAIKKLALTLYAACHAILQPNPMSSAQLTGTIGTTMFWYITNYVVCKTREQHLARVAVSEGPRGNCRDFIFW